MVIIYSTAYLRQGLGLILRAVGVDGGIVIYMGLLSRTGHGNVAIGLGLLSLELNMRIINAGTHSGGAVLGLLSTLSSIVSGGNKGIVGDRVLSRELTIDAIGETRVVYGNMVTCGGRGFRRGSHGVSGVVADHIFTCPVVLLLLYIIF